MTFRINNANLCYLIIPKQKGCPGVWRLKQGEEFWSNTTVIRAVWPATEVRGTASISPTLPLLWDWEFTNSPVHQWLTGYWDLISQTMQQHLAQKLKQKSGMTMSPPAWKPCMAFTSKVKSGKYLYLNTVTTTVRKNPFMLHCCTQISRNIHKIMNLRFPIINSNVPTDIPVGSGSYVSIQTTLFDYSCLYVFYILICKPRNLPN